MFGEPVSAPSTDTYTQHLHLSPTPGPLTLPLTFDL